MDKADSRILNIGMTLEELFPQRPEFSLPNGKTYHLRVPDLTDRARFKDILGEDPQKVFRDLEWDKIAKLVYRLLEEKAEFTAKQETFHDDDGVEVTALITGPALLMKEVKSIDQATQMLQALVLALRLGDPLIDKAVAELQDEKKSTKSPTGRRSSTSSAANMDTHRKSLAV